jgi:hypothetical protein
MKRVILGAVLGLSLMTAALAQTSDIGDIGNGNTRTVPEAASALAAVAALGFAWMLRKRLN